MIAMVVDNTPSRDVPATQYGRRNGVTPDYVVNGGLYRDVYLTFTDPVCIPDPVFGGDDGGGIFVSYSDVSSASAKVAIKTWVRNFSNSSVDATVKWTILNANNASVGSKYQELGAIVITASSNNLGTCSDTIYAVDEPIPVSLDSKKVSVKSRRPLINSIVSHGFLRIRVDRLDAGQTSMAVKIFTSNGRLMKTVVKENLSTSSIEVPCDIRKYSRGVYIVKVSIDGGRNVQRTFLRL